MRWAYVALLAVVAVAGCGEDSSDAPPDPTQERSDRPAKPPRGWRTIRNAPSGFTVAVPPGWKASRRGSSTFIQSRDRLLAVTLAADRSSDGREAAAEQYARATLEALPGFRRARVRSRGRVRGSPYRSARVEAAGRPEEGRTRQRATVAAFVRPGRVTYSAVAFANARVRSRSNERGLTRMLRTLRARAPRP